MATRGLLKHSVRGEGQPSHQCTKELGIAYVGIWLPSETKSVFVVSYCISTCPSIRGAEDRKTLLDFQVYSYSQVRIASEQKGTLQFLYFTLKLLQHTK